MIPAKEYVVVGASGVLAPLGQELRTGGAKTIGVSRGSRLEAGSWDERMAMDTQDAQAIASWVAVRSEPADVLIAYSPAVGELCWEALSGLARRFVVVATSEWVDVAPSKRPWAGLDPLVIQLGWIHTDVGIRWHTPQEVSDAVAGARPWPANGVLTLGQTTPWATRPRAAMDG